MENVMPSRGTESNPDLADAKLLHGRVVSDHTVKAFDTDLNDLIRMLSEMGWIAEKAVAQSINALATRNVGLAKKIVELDSTIDALQREIESKAVATVALRQPVAVD